MASINLQGAGLGSNLQQLLMAPDIQPGDQISYQTAKACYEYHPLGGKLADFPIAIAQSRARKISVPKGPEERLVEAFEKEWQKVGADRHIFNIARLARVYGVASIALLAEGVDPNTPIDFVKLAGEDLGFNVLDPLNTAGSIVLDQNPNAVDFQKVLGISVQGQAYHRSRTCTLMNEDPIYISYSQAGFGYVGRSVYQRALFMLKSFINTLTTDDLIALKAGVLIAKLKQQSSAIDAMMAGIAGQKRNMVNEAQTGNTISISIEESIESLDLHNLDSAYGMARKNIIENIASASGTPSKLILAETFAEGFGEGTEDARHIAQYINHIREWMGPVYAYFDKIVQYRAWNPQFYKALQNEFPELGRTPYKQAFYDWSNSFSAEWPSLLEEPDSEKVKVDDTRLKALIAMVEVVGPMLDPENKARLIQTVFDNVNSMKLLFPTPFEFDVNDLAQYTPPEPEKEPSEPKPFAASDSVTRLPARNRG